MIFTSNYEFSDETQYNKSFDMAIVRKLKLFRKYRYASWFAYRPDVRGITSRSYNAEFLFHHVP